MARRPKELELEDERATQRRYRKILSERPSLRSAYQGPSSGEWTQEGLPSTKKHYSGDIYGRVGLVHPDEDGESEFYIGETYADLGDVCVYGWSTPVACTFFRGKVHHPSCASVGVVRTFSSDKGQIVDFLDETLRDDAPAEPFAKGGLSIPAPPSRPVPRPAARPDSEPSPDPDPVVDPVPPSPPLDGATDDSAPHTVTAPSMRAESLLRSKMLAPRTSGLSPVLSTLQPEQYELVTLPAMDSVIIEGQPGTGKTIIASHRAAYLVNEETPAENALDGNILVVGPTVGYSDHIRGVINGLVGSTERIRVISLPELAYEILGIKQPPRGHTSKNWRDGAWELAKFVRLALRELRQANIAVSNVEVAYDYLRHNAGTLAKDRDWAQYLRSLPPYREALSDRIHPPLLAFIKWEIEKPSALDFVEHVIVDEAQDVTPLEWYLLDEINEADAWTILGDTNQRRSDHTLASWDKVLDVIAIDPETPVRTLKRAYRSTKPILDFANRLLPRDQRKVDAFQGDGPVPTVTKVRLQEIGDTVVREMHRLRRAYPAGTLAVISTSPATVTVALRTRGWRASLRDSTLWEKEGDAVTVAVPDDMRGLEFDGVIVVEPADFPQNLGRKGPLYTALTRANRELSVVHSKSLPDELRRSR